MKAILRMTGGSGGDRAGCQWQSVLLVWMVFVLWAVTGLAGDLPGRQHILLNASYDPTRELYQEINAAFAAQWKTSNQGTVTIRQSHGGSGKQARSVMEGLEADVVTLALAYDIDAIAKGGRMMSTQWQARLPHNSAPYVSAIVFLVRKGNPKGIKDWGDLTRPGIKVITPNPKTSGGARWNYLAAYGYELARTGGDDRRARAYIERLFRNAPILDTGARGATTTFLQRKLGDVLIAWENEALLAMRELAPGQCELVHPSISILAEPCVAWVDAVVNKRGTQTLAKEYLEFLYTRAGQEIVTRHYFRPRDPALLEQHKATFPPMKLFTVDDVFGGWARAHITHFAEGGVFDSIYANNR